LQGKEPPLTYETGVSLVHLKGYSTTMRPVTHSEEKEIMIKLIIGSIVPEHDWDLHDGYWVREFKKLQLNVN
jgi:hypothetical protein